MNKNGTILKACWIPFFLFLPAGCAGAIPGDSPRTNPSPRPGCAADEWTVVRTAHFGQSALSVMFGDESFGVAADLSGKIYYSEDGGTTWTGTIKAGASRAALEVSEQNRRVWYIGVGGDIELSTDRGRTWQSAGPFPWTRHVEYISFADDQNGWGMTTEQPDFYATADGGRNWTALPLPEGMGAPAALHLRTPDDGYLLDVAGNLFISADGGHAWTARSLGLPEGKTIPTLNHSAVVRFSDAMHGVIALNLIGGGEGLVRGMRTADGGATWMEEAVPVPMGMFHLSRDGVYLTHMDLYDNGKITLLCSGKSLHP
jgi:hypothetical protein